MPASHPGAVRPRLFNAFMSATTRKRARGALVAIAFPVAAVLAMALWIDLHGAELGTGPVAAVVLVTLTALSARISIVVAPRTRVSTAGAFVVATALVGGPLLGACAGAATEALTVDDPWWKRSSGFGAGALQGFAVGVVGEQLTQHGTSGAVVGATVGLLTGCAVYAASLVLVWLDRGIWLRRELRTSWRAIGLSWLLPGPLLVAFLYVFQTAPGLALVYAAGLLLVLAVANRFRVRLERRLAADAPARGSMR